MNLSVTKTTRGSGTARSAHRKPAPLSAIDTRESSARRTAARVTDVPERHSAKPVTFDSSL